jgi:DNA-binding Xre family transcriptional regulator
MNRSSAVAHPNVRWLRPVALPTVLLVDDQESEYKRAFAATVLWLRVKQGIGSQRDLAKAVGVSEATAQRWEDERKAHLPNAWELRRLCEVLACEPHELIYPEPLTDRERMVTRRAARAGRRAPQAS